MENKSTEPKLTQKETAKQIGFSDSTLSRCRIDINMQSPYKSSNKLRKNVTDCQNTSKCVKDCQNVKFKLKGGAVDKEGGCITTARNVVDII